uniref:Putative secreted protein n=1 Tax=Anopheles triannulatus TaxID=58253 RepID=A0A2M4B6H3_9DIPT
MAKLGLGILQAVGSDAEECASNDVRSVSGTQFFKLRLPHAWPYFRQCVQRCNHIHADLQNERIHLFDFA